MHRPIRAVFYAEAVLNFLIAAACLLLPGRFIGAFASEPGGPIAEAFVRWYGVLMIGLTYILLKALRNGSYEILKPVLQGFLIADVLQLAALWMLADAAGEWTVGALIFGGLVIFFGLMRIYALRVRPDLLAQLHPAVWSSRGKRRGAAPSDQ